MFQHESAWTFKYSVDCGVPVQFAWDFWTNVRNWALDTDVVSIEIDGPFAAGARGVTNSKSSGRVEWRIVETHPGKSVIEFPMPGAVGRFTWIFEEIGGSCRITQQCSLQGDQAEIYAKQVGPSFEAGIPLGMRKLRDAIESAARRS